MDRDKNTAAPVSGVLPFYTRRFSRNYHMPFQITNSNCAFLRETNLLTQVLKQNTGRINS